MQHNFLNHSIYVYRYMYLMKNPNNVHLYSCLTWILFPSIHLISLSPSSSCWFEAPPAILSLQPVGLVLDMLVCVRAAAQGCLQSLDSPKLRTGTSGFHIEEGVVVSHWASEVVVEAIPWSGEPVWMGFHNVLKYPKDYLSVRFHKLFSKSTKFTYSCLPLCALLYDVLECEGLVGTSPLFPEPCMSVSTMSAVSDILLIIILARILLSIDSRVIPLQLLQLLRAPFFGNLKITSHQTLNLLPTQMWTVATGWWLLFPRSKVHLR